MRQDRNLGRCVRSSSSFYGGHSIQLHAQTCINTHRLEAHLVRNIAYGASPVAASVSETGIVTGDTSSEQPGVLLSSHSVPVNWMLYGDFTSIHELWS
jgi:hypothetical protein